MFNTGNCASVPLVANIDGSGDGLFYLVHAYSPF